MSDFKFECPKCGQKIVCDTSNAGMQIPCPGCQAVLTVPPPPPAVPAAGPAKLGINKSAHTHHAAAPAPGSAPPAPAWGTKPAAAPVKKKFPVKLIAAIGVIIIVLAVGWFGFGAPYLKEQAEKEKQKQEEAARQAAAQQQAAAEAAAAAAAKLKAAKAAWTMDLANADFPERHASGKLHGADFSVETVIFQAGSLVLRQDSGFSRQFIISVALKPGESLTGKSVQVTAADAASQPRVLTSWKEDPARPPGTQTFTRGYAMKLTFGAPANGRVPGKIYLCLPDQEQSYVAGNFEIGPRTGAPQPVAGQPAETKRARVKKS